MSVNNFIPRMWSDRLNQKLKKALVYAMLCNRDWEGTISQKGDSVQITAVGPVTIGNYTKNVTTITPETLNDEAATLIIDQSKYFCFEVDDVDQRQAGSSVMVGGMDQAAYGLADTADQYIASLYTGASYISAAPVAVNSVNVLASLLLLSQALTEANIPKEGRIAVIPPWVTTKLSLAKVLLENTSNTAFENGFVGRAAGFNLHESNNVPTTNGGTEFKILSGIPKAITFADQINKIEAFRPESAFSDAVKGLHLYGAKVIYPDALAVGDWTEAAEPV